MATRITPPGFTVQMAYNERDAQLTVSCAGTVTVYDEDECDRLLRVVEYAADPAEDLTEFFQPEYKARAYRVAVQFVDHAAEIGKFVYD